MHGRRIEVASSQSKFLLCLWRSTIGIISPELSNPEIEGRAVPALMSFTSRQAGKPEQAASAICNTKMKTKLF